MEVNEFIIPKEIMFSKEIGKKEKLLFSIIHAFAIRNQNQCKLTNAELSAVLGVPTNQINRIIKKLKDKQFITAEYRNRTFIPGKSKQPTYLYINYDPKPNIVRTIHLNDKFIPTTDVKKRRRRKHDGQDNSRERVHV